MTTAPDAPNPQAQGKVHPPYPTRGVAGPTNPLGMAVFLATDVVTFVLLLVAHVYLRRTSTGPGQGALSEGQEFWFSLLLWGSSAVLVLADRLSTRGTRQAGWLYLLTALMGAGFLVGQGLEYAHLAGQGLAVDRNLFFTGFYTLTGLHGLHILAGLPMLLGLSLLAFRGELTRKRVGVQQALSLFWHFVDAVWVVLFLVIYVWKGP